MISHVKPTILCHMYEMSISAARSTHFLFQVYRLSRWPTYLWPTFEISFVGIRRSNLVPLLLLQGTIYCKKHLFPSNDHLFQGAFTSPLGSPSRGGYSLCGSPSRGGYCSYSMRRFLLHCTQWEEDLRSPNAPRGWCMSVALRNHILLSRGSKSCILLQAYVPLGGPSIAYVLWGRSLFDIVPSIGSVFSSRSWLPPGGRLLGRLISVKVPSSLNSNLCFW